MKIHLALGPLCLLILATGCRSLRSGGSEESTSAATPHEEKELALILDGFVGEFSTKIAKASNEINAASPDSEIRRATLLWRLTLIPLCQAAVFDRNPRVAFLDVWGLTAQMTHQFEAGEYKDSFGPSQSIAITACKDLEAAIKRVGSNFMAPDDLAQVEPDVQRFATQHPPGEYFTSTIAADKDLSAYAKAIISVPLSAINPFKGVDKTAESIHEVSVVGDRFARIATEMPSKVRWETELLLLEAGASGPGKEVLEDLSTLADSVASLARTASSLPQTLGEQVTLVLEQFDQKQAGIQGTLKQTQATVQDVDQALVQAVAVGDSVDAAAQSLTKMGGALEDAIQAAAAMLKEFEGPPKEPGAPREPTSPPTQPFQLSDVGDAADKLTVTLRELHSVVAEVRALTQPGELGPLLKAVDSTAAATVDYVTLRLAALILLVFLAAIAYRIIGRRVVRRA